MKKIFSFISMLLLVMISWAQESNVDSNEEGKDFSKLKHAWKAQWITHPTESTLDYGIFLFRKTFNLINVPSSFVVHVSADNRYRLYVNGNYITYGPAIGDIAHYRYETMDIARWLKKGTNCIAAEVVNFGEYRRAAQQTFQTGFILQSDANDGKISTGLSEWKVIKNKAYEGIPFTTDSIHSYYCAGPGEKIDAGLYPWGWNDPAFDDSSWLAPKKCTVEFAVGRGFLFGSTWFLVPRDIPLMSETVERFKSIVRTENLKALNPVHKGTSTTIPANTKVSVLLDNKTHTTGYPTLFISKGKGSRIKITYAESLFKDISGLSSADNFTKGEDPKGNRNEVNGKKIFGYYDLIYPDGGMKRSFKTLSRKTFRYVQLDIETAGEELVLDDYYNIYATYPFAEKAKFNSSDPELKKIWDAAWLTIKNSSEDHFFDPYYEQLQYIGDTRIEALISIYVSGDDRLMRKAIRQFDDSRIPEGLTQSRYPCYIVQIIPTYSLLWIDMIHDYFMYRNDMEFVKSFIPGMKMVLDWFADKVDQKGMPNKLEWWNFTDWSQGFKNGVPPGADNNYSANVALQYVYALQNAIEMFRFLGYRSEADKYALIEQRVRNSVMANCDSKERQMIAETPEKRTYSQHTNIWAILTNTVPLAEQKSLMNKILNEKDLIQATLYFKFYLFRALQKAGMGDQYLNLMNPWKTMLAKGMTTFGETDVNPRSECHGWSASPDFDFLHTVAGIYPGSPGFKNLVIAPNFGYLSFIDVAFPHPDGIISLNLKKDKEKVTGSISMPANLTGKFIWKGKTYPLKGGENKLSGLL